MISTIIPKHSPLTNIHKKQNTFPSKFNNQGLLRDSCLALIKLAETQQLLLRRNDFYKERTTLSPQNCFLCESCKSVSKEYTDKVYIYILKNTNAHVYLKVHSKWKSFTEVFLDSRKHVKCYEGYIDVK